MNFKSSATRLYDFIAIRITQFHRMHSAPTSFDCNLAVVSCEETSITTHLRFKNKKLLNEKLSDLPCINVCVCVHVCHEGHIYNREGYLSANDNFSTINVRDS